jgi:KaiC/GvpD/RAD55 family RecA-like ATPase/tetratricopeptide (TPR) repeat protein
MPKLGLLSEPVLVGREKELDQLANFLSDTIVGKGRTVFISGEAGSGKSRLAKEFLMRAKDQGVTILAGWCLSDAEVPYFPFIEVFNAYSSVVAEEEPMSPVQSRIRLDLEKPAPISNDQMAATSWLTGLRSVGKAEKAGAISPQVWKDQAFEAVARTLHDISAQVPLILFLEDLHWADSGSLALLHYLSRAIDSREKVLLLGSFRSEELTADAEGHPHPLAEVLRVMRREELFVEIQVPSLDSAHVSELAESMVGGSLEQNLAQKLAAESRGNPLFIVESMRMLYERKSLFQEENQWRLAVDELGIPSKIKDIILRRLAVLKYAQRRVLDAASVIGEKFDVGLLATVLGQDSLDVLETLNVLAHSTSLVCVEEEHYRFDHARSRETLYEELSPPLKRGYHARIAEKLENAQGGILPLSDLAYHFGEAGNKEKALNYAVLAAKDELARFSNAQAIKHFLYVLKNSPEGAEYAEERNAALEGLGDAYTANAMYADAIRTFDELSASTAGKMRLRAIRKAMDAAFLKGDKPQVLLEYAKRAEELAAYDRLEMARVLDNRGRAFGFAGKGEGRQDLADYDAALQVFEEENSLADVAEALWRTGVVRTMYEESAVRGYAELLRSIAIFRELGDTRKEVEPTLYLSIGFFNRTLFPESANAFQKVLSLGEKIGCFSEMALAASYLAFAPEGEGKIDQAIAMQKRALDYCKKTDVGYVECRSYGELMKLYVMLGDIKSAEECDRKICEMSPEVTSHMMTQVNVTIGKVFLLAAKNNWQIDLYSEVDKKIISDLKGLPIMDWALPVLHGVVLLKQGKVEEAKTRFGEAARILALIDQTFRHGNLQASLMMKRQASTGEEVELRLYLANVARTPVFLTGVEGLVSPQFTVGNLQGSGILDLKRKIVNPFSIETVKLQIKPTEAGTFTLNPKITYIDDQEQTKTAEPTPVTLNVQSPKPAFEVLPGRVTTGDQSLDRLLVGGIPDKYAVVLSAPSSDERQQLIKRFVEAGPSKGETTIYLTCEVSTANQLVQALQTNFYVGVCNPQADSALPSLPNVMKFKGTENLTEIDIALTKLFRTIDLSQIQPRRVCIDLISDVLLQHHAVTTRKWLSGLVATLKSKGFTTMAVIDPLIARDEVPAISSLFDGEIRISEKETAQGIIKTLKVLKLLNKDYLKDELALS